MPEPKQQPKMEDLEKLGDEMAALLEGHHPDVQGMALAHTVVVWLGKLPPELRHQAFERLVRAARATFDTVAKEHAERHGH